MATWNRDYDFLAFFFFLAVPFFTPDALLDFVRIFLLAKIESQLSEYFWVVPLCKMVKVSDLLEGVYKEPHR